MAQRRAAKLCQRRRRSQSTCYTYDQVLMLLRRRFDMLFVRRHESMPRRDVFRDFGIVHLEEQAQLPGDWIFDFRNLISRTSNLDKLLYLNLGLLRLLSLELLGIDGSIFGFSCCSPRQVCLMLLSLRMRQVRSFVRVQSQAETALDSSQMRS